MLAFYEGVPVLRDIPYADRIPVVRELIVGRVGTERAKAADLPIGICRTFRKDRARGATGQGEARPSPGIPTL
jgi:hypothetical protein